MVKQKHQFFTFMLCAADAAAITTACYLAWLIRRATVEGFLAESWENYLIKEPLVVLMVPLTIAALWTVGLYRPRRDRSIWNEQWQVGRASVVAMVSLVVFLWAIGNDELIEGKAHYGPWIVYGVEMHAGRVQLGSLALLLPLFLGIHRAIFRIALRALRRRGWNLRHVAIIGVGRVGRIACQTIERNSWTGLTVAYFISHKDQNRRTECLKRPVLGGLKDLDSLLRVCPVDAVYLAIPNARAAVLPRVLAALEKFSVDVRIIPDVNPRYVPQSMSLSELDGMPILSYRESPTGGLGGAVKRGLDIAGALAALVLFGPVMLAAAIAVRLSSPGPAMFRQRRVSLGGQTFRILKFRTMYDERDEAGPRVTAAAEPRWTERDDPRITPVGRFLRRTSIDELPQLFNVLRGEMSLVGPRPERPELIERFREDWRGYMLRQHVKAGMTGWAQVNGLRGNTCLRKRLQYDRYYIRNWSLWLDLRILAITMVRGFVHRNAH